MHLKELKQKTSAELVSMAEELEIEGASTMRRQDLMFCVLRELAEDEEYTDKIMGVGTIEVMQDGFGRSEEHTSELQSLMRISYAVFCLKKKIQNICIETSYSILTALLIHHSTNNRKAQ